MAAVLTNSIHAATTTPVAASSTSATSRAVSTPHGTAALVFIIAPLGLGPPIAQPSVWLRGVAAGRNALVRMPGSPRQHNRGGEHHDARRLGYGEHRPRAGVFGGQPGQEWA